MNKVIVNDKIQKGYSYYRTEEPGINFHIDFKPEITPKEMLELGVFGGKYMTDCSNEFPDEWFENAKLAQDLKDVDLNFYKVDASLRLSHWVDRGWIYKDDPRGWFQWYCRYYMGRRILDEDLRQIKRWRSITRHAGAIKKNCKVGDWNCRKKQRQVLLHWAYDSRSL